MANTSSPFSATFSISLLTLCSLFVACHGGDADAAGMFVFGSSLVDNGNNNFLWNTTARADYLPYGIDSREGPSGRFSNGKNVVDALGELLGLPAAIPPFMHPGTRGRRIVHGVNYASGGSGILDQTGSVGGKVISFKEQITNFENRTLPQLKCELRRRKRNKDVELSKYLFVVGTGGNDYLLNYFLRSRMGDAMPVSLQDFTTDLITTLSSHLKRLYGLGARKFVLFSVQAIGCVPAVRANAHAENGDCVEAINEAALLFNTQLRSLAENPDPNMPGSHMVYINSYDMIRDIIHSPGQGGFTETSKACCEVAASNGILCRSGGRPCTDRDAHVFFDGLHPTEAVNIWIAKKAFGTDVDTEAFPFNVRRLARHPH